MIPKRIFYVWGYNEPKSRLANICIENWREKMPDFEIIELNEKSKEWFDFDFEYENNIWFKTVYDLKMWAYVADYIRVKTVYDHGGIYLDTDVTAYKDFTPLLEHKMFIGNCLNNIPEMAVFGAERKHPLIGAMVDFYKEEIWKNPNFIITKIFKEIMVKMYGLEPDLNEIVQNGEITIYPPKYFNPLHFDMEFSHDLIKHETYSVHWMGSSWHSRKNLFFLSNKHRIPLPTLLKQLAFIEKSDKNANEKVKMVN